MGCDIHMWAETRSGPDSPWTLVPGDPEEIAKEIAKINGYRKPTDSPELSTAWDGEIERIPMQEAQVYTSRNYGLFGILAGVRWRAPHQFPKKGVPDDASPEYKAEVANWDADGHSHSYLSLKELVEWPHWHEIASSQEEDYDDPLFRALWGRFTAMVERMTDEERRQKLNDNFRDWPTPPKIKMSNAGYASSFYRDTLPRLISLCGINDLENVRVVFFFDN